LSGSASGSIRGSSTMFSGATGTVRASRRRFSTRGPKNRRGTVVTFRLRAPARVVFVVHGPSPNCGVAGKKSVRGHSGLNRVRLNGRFEGRTLSPGTYEVVVVARRGNSHNRVGRISIQVVPPGSRVRRPGSAPVFRCTPPAAQTGIPGAGLFVSPPGQNQRVRPPQPAPKQQPSPTPGRSGVLNAPPFHIGTGSGGIDMILAVLLYGTLGIGGAVLLVYVVRFFRGSWNP
jgi:hypothetical protein